MLEVVVTPVSGMERDRVHRSVSSRWIWLAMMAAVGLGLLWLRPFAFSRVAGPVEIYRGVWYSCESIDAGEEGSGLAHIVKIDLSAPGIELYATPVDPQVEEGAQYRLTFAPRVAAAERLAVVINGTQFHALVSPPLPGTPANSNETIVADGQVNHIHPHSYLLWFDQNLVPHVETTKPPRPQVLSRARWGISGVSVAMRNGRPRSNTPGKPDRQSCIGINPREKMLWLAVFDNASVRVAMESLARAGATEGIRVDGGDSTTMVIGSQATGVDPGTLLGGQRPVPTFFGVRARPLNELR